ncbi:MAG: insulinase family protein, partial [Acidobacteriota bacterium]
MVAEADANPSVQIRWRTVSFVNSDQHALDILASILAGRTGRFYKSIVEEHGMATGEPYAYGRSMKFDGMFEVGAELADGVPHQAVEEALLGEISKLKNEPIPADELQKVKNQSLANSYRRLQSNFYLMLQLLIYDAMGDWHYLNDASAAVQAVTAEDVMRVAKRYFTSEGRNTLWYVRKEGTEEDPALAALDGQAKAMAKSMINQISTETDTARLEQALAQMQGNIGQAPDDFKPALELVITKIQERLSELDAGKGE